MKYCYNFGIKPTDTAKVKKGPHMNSHLEIIDNIKSLKKDSETLLIGIDGFGGSGKSSLAKSIKKFFPHAYIVEMDDFYSPTLKRADFQRVLDQVIEPLRNNTEAVYQIYNWKNDSFTSSIPINPGGIVLIEGVFSLTQELINNYDIKIWVDCDQNVGLERGVARDGEQVRDKWTNIWMPLEKEYMEKQNPQGKADFIIKMSEP